MLQILQRLSPNQTQDLPAVGYYFENGIWCFVDNMLVACGRIKNNTCVAKKLLLHNDEPPGDPNAPVRWLVYPPRAVFVEPHGVQLGDICSAVCPECPYNCMPVLPIKRTFNVKLTPTQDCQLSADECSFKMSRTAIPLGAGYAVTDYWAQGVSFKDDLWFADLRPPRTGHFQRASIAVVISRFRNWDAFRALAPLWPDGDTAAEAKVIDAWYAASKMDPKLRAEMQRLDRLSQHTVHTCYDLLRQHCSGMFDSETSIVE